MEIYKYLKYKNKYLNFKNQIGSGPKETLKIITTGLGDTIVDIIPSTIYYELWIKIILPKILIQLAEFKNIQIYHYDRLDARHEHLLDNLVQEESRISSKITYNEFSKKYLTDNEYDNIMFNKGDFDSQILLFDCAHIFKYVRLGNVEPFSGDESRSDYSDEKLTYNSIKSIYFGYLGDAIFDTGSRKHRLKNSQEILLDNLLTTNKTATGDIIITSYIDRLLLLKCKFEPEYPELYFEDYINKDIRQQCELAFKQKYKPFVLEAFDKLFSEEIKQNLLAFAYNLLYRINNCEELLTYILMEALTLTRLNLD